MIRVAFFGRSAACDQQALLRQVRTCQSVLPDNGVIVACFYDLESGLIDLAERVQSPAHDVVGIPIPL